MFTFLQLLAFSLGLLYWSLTWNILSEKKYSKVVKPKLEIDNLESSKADWKDLSSDFATKVPMLNNRDSSSPASHAAGIMLPFYEWKQKTLNNQDTKTFSTFELKKKEVKRLLNYASYKCGAKILNSNKEAKSRKAVLDEHVDEYMLNPCRARIWFVIELCDTIQASQIELANYELYSSSPKKFSVFSSNVYPSQNWLHLGTFKAQDRRTVQKFNFVVQEFGKYIKVLLFSHYGKEHYCPISVVRILGTSMEDEFDGTELTTFDIGQNSSINSSIASNDNSSKRTDITLGPSNRTNTTLISLDNNVLHNVKIYKPISSSLAGLYKVYASYCAYPSCKKHLPHNFSYLLCRFVKLALGKMNVNLLHKNYCLKYEVKNKLDVHFNGNLALREMPYTLNITDTAQLITKSLNVTSSSVNVNQTNSVKFQEKFNGNSKNHNEKDYHSNMLVESELKHDQTKMASKLNSHSINVERNCNTLRILNLGCYKQAQQQLDTSSRLKDCHCDELRLKGDMKKYFSGEDHLSRDVYTESGKMFKSRIYKFSDEGALITDVKNIEIFSVNSATSNQKESVLVKLNKRIIDLEVNFSLIGLYLQELSENYRHRVHDMLRLFNETAEALNTTIQKADNLNDRQETAVKDLREQVQTLSESVDFLLGGKKGLVNQLIEMHMFLLAVEVIIISFIFTLWVRHFKMSSPARFQQTSLQRIS